jgi:hypothetical protein
LDKSLSIILNRSFNSGVIPDAWLIANITPLFKQGGKKLRFTTDLEEYKLNAFEIID